MMGLLLPLLPPSPILPPPLPLCGKEEREEEKRGERKFRGGLGAERM